LRGTVAEPVFLTSTRHPVDGDLLCEFKENHSHATDHLLYLPSDPVLRARLQRARSVVPVFFRSDIADPPSQYNFLLEIPAASPPIETESPLFLSMI
ncbi:hypothetical protein RN23_21565, partial [Yersinia pestis subsp. microtus bv. Ulegeica]